MGHYDSCYEADEREKSEKEAEEVENEIRYKLYDLNLDEKKTLLLIIQNLDAIRNIASLIKKLTKT
jgi:hypothetical protein